MQSLRNLIQSPAALFTFEAAARHLSFTKAAAELNVTQAAVSHSMKQLEASLGVGLFERGHRSIRLTAQGERFYNDVALGLAHIRRSAEAIGRRRGERHVTLSCSTAFANYWMVPRLADFHAANPEVDLRLETSERDVDLGAEGIPLGIRRGPDDRAWPGCLAERLAREAIHPVASPAYLARHGRPTWASDLLGHTLIHLEEPFRPRPSWEDWFAAQGLAWRDRGKGLRLNDYALVLQAAMAGEGIALGWHHLVERLAGQGLLALLFDEPYAEGRDFWVVSRAEPPLEPHARQVRDWLLAQRD